MFRRDGEKSEVCRDRASPMRGPVGEQTRVQAENRDGRRSAMVLRIERYRNVTRLILLKGTSHLVRTK